MIDRYLDSIIKSLESKNWYAALFTALAIPDICGDLEQPSEKSSRVRYVNWYNKYMLPQYSVTMPSLREPHVFLSGDDCYALRCSLLHQGTGDIGKQKVSTTLESVRFNEPSDEGGGCTVTSIRMYYNYELMLSAMTLLMQLANGYQTCRVMLVFKPEYNRY